MTFWIRLGKNAAVHLSWTARHESRHISSLSTSIDPAQVARPWFIYGSSVLPRLDPSCQPVEWSCTLAQKTSAKTAQPCLGQISETKRPKMHVFVLQLVVTFTLSLARN